MAKFIIIEDIFNYRIRTKSLLTDFGHEVVLMADGLDGALEAIKNIGSLGVDIVILDGNLSSGENSGNDGKVISVFLRTNHPNTKIITFSSSVYLWGNVFVKKEILFHGQSGSDHLRRVIDKILGNFPRKPGSDKVIHEDDWNQEVLFGHCPACGSLGVEEIGIPGDDMCFYCPDTSCLTIMGKRSPAKTKWTDVKPLIILEKEKEGWSWNKEHYSGQEVSDICVN